MSAPQRIQPITVVTDVWQPEEVAAQRFVDAPEPVPLRHDTARAAWSRYARQSRPMRRKV